MSLQLTETLRERRWARPLQVIQLLARDRSGAFGLCVVGAILLVAVFAPLLAPHDPYAINIPARFQGPSTTHLLGTDGLGRDTLSRLIIATRTAMEVALPSVAIAFSLGLFFGLLAGYLGGIVDSAMIVVNDTLQAFPGIVLALVVIALVGPSLRNVVVLIAIAIAPGYFRVSRALVLTAREETYVEAERALGARTLRILSHVLPNVVAPMMVLVAMDIPGVIGIDAGLSFLGLGVQPPTPSWGGILSDGFASIEQSLWPVATATAILALATLGFTFLGEALGSVIDPRAGRRASGEHPS
jgi:peptide/nickel transport system permease protein